MNSVNSDNVNAVRKIYNAFGTGDIATVVAGMSPQIIWREADNFPYADKNPYVGPDAVVAGVFGRIAAEWDNWQLADTVFHSVDSDGVLVTGRYKAAHKQTGKVLNAQFAHLWRLENGMALTFQQYTDTFQAVQVIN